MANRAMLRNRPVAGDVRRLQSSRECSENRTRRGNWSLVTSTATMRGRKLRETERAQKLKCARNGKNQYNLRAGVWHGWQDRRP